MKSLFLLVPFFAISFVAVAQIPAGTKLLGGNIGYTSNKNYNGQTEQKNSSFVVNPRFGWTTKENVVNGIELSYSSNKYTPNNQPSVSSRVVGLSFFKQKYLPLVNSFMVFGEGSVGGYHGWRKDRYKTYGLNAGLGAGIAYKAGNKFLFTLSAPNALNFNIQHVDEYFYNGTVRNGQSSFNAGLGTNISLQSMQFGVVLLF